MFSCCGATKLHVDLLYVQRRCLKETLTKLEVVQPCAQAQTMRNDVSIRQTTAMNIKIVPTYASTIQSAEQSLWEPEGENKLAITRLARLPTSPHQNPRCNSAGCHGGWVILRIQSVSSRHGYRHNVLRQYGSHRRGVDPLQNEIENGYKRKRRKNNH